MKHSPRASHALLTAPAAAFACTVSRGQPKATRHEEQGCSLCTELQSQALRQGPCTAPFPRTRCSLRGR